jgi:hypothetical protein
MRSIVVPKGSYYSQKGSSGVWVVIGARNDIISGCVGLQPL